MNVAILCNEVKPIPAVEGGAVETLVELLLKNNENNKLINIDIYSKENQEAIKESKKYKNSLFYYIRYSKKPLIQKLLNKVYRIFKIPNYFDLFCFNAAREIRKKDYDWIIVENRPLFIFTLRRMGIKSKVALHLHNDFLNEKDYLTNEVISRYDKILGVSEYLSNKVKANKKNDKVHTFLNRVDVNLFSNKNSNKENNKINNETIILFHGRIIKEKGVYELIKAFNIAYKQNNKLRLLIAGEFSDKKYYKKVANLLSKTQHNNISLLGYLDHPSLAKIIQSADIVVLPSLWNEPFGLTIIESMAAGKPIISTNVGAIPEILGDSSGIVIENNSELIKNLSIEIINLANNIQKQKIYSDNALKKVMAKYNADYYLEDLIKILKQKEIG
ncbi:glycosyltransferase family 4 protein [Terribacillus aidingensis]|uniref:glycosyltransferase family 4 protein n=1 Tax=Terribacillus aidingensis TaxID=586416 RepID=UPI00344C7A86